MPGVAWATALFSPDESARVAAYNAYLPGVGPSRGWLVPGRGGTTHDSGWLTGE